MDDFEQMVIADVKHMMKSSQINKNKLAERFITLLLIRIVNLIEIKPIFGKPLI